MHTLLFSCGGRYCTAAAAAVLCKLALPSKGGAADPLDAVAAVVELTLSQCLVGALILNVGLRLRNRSNGIKTATPFTDTSRQMVAVSLAHLVGNFCTNAMYLLSSASITQVLKASEPVCTVLLMRWFVGTRYSHAVYLCIATIIVGVSMAAAAGKGSAGGSVSLWPVVLLCLVSNTTIPVRNVLSKVILNGPAASPTLPIMPAAQKTTKGVDIESMPAMTAVSSAPFPSGSVENGKATAAISFAGDSVALFAVVATQGAAMLLPVYLAIKAPAALPLLMGGGKHALLSTPNPRDLLLAGLFHGWYNVFSFFCLDALGSAMSHAVANVFKRVFSITIALISFRELPTAPSAVGMAIAACGLAGYTVCTKSKFATVAATAAVVAPALLAADAAQQQHLTRKRRIVALAATIVVVLYVVGFAAFRTSSKWNSGSVTAVVGAGFS